MHSLQQQKGLSLIELMIALLISMVVIAAVIEIFLSGRQMYRVQNAKAHMQENGRYAMHVLTDTIVNTGYQGCGSFQVDDSEVLNTLNTPNSYLWNFSVPVQGAEATSTSVWSPLLDASITSPLGGSDVLTLRGVHQPEVLVTAHPGGSPPGSAAIHVNTNNLLERFDIVMVTDCESAAVFQITSANPNTSGTLTHNTGVGTPGNSTKELGKDYTGAWISRLLTQSFYIRNNPDGVPSLYLKQGSDAAIELVSGIETLQLEYGIDTDEDGSVDIYQTADQIGDLSRIISIKVELVVISEEDNLTVDGAQSYVLGGVEITPADRRLRTVFSKTVTLRNRVP